MPAHAGDAEREALLEHSKKIAPVFLHPQCRNCHAAGDAPLQTDADIPHVMNVKRGKAGVSMPGANCVICHTITPIRRESGLPPAVMHWRMPPAKRKMRFEGLSSAELCQRLKNPEITGRKTVGKSMIHVLRDVLVSWAFEPGPGHTAPPIGKKVLFKHLGCWVRGGAPCDDDPVK
jgi:hypothetical protein